MKWKLDSHKHNITGTGWHLRDEDGCTVAIVLGTPEGEMKPIADLIAAAPDLLELLEACQKAYEMNHIYDMTPNLFERVDAAIAKAKGVRDE